MKKKYKTETTAGRPTAANAAAGKPEIRRPVIETRDAARDYVMGDVVVRALRGVDLKVERGEMVSVMGPSGSGKSTLMNLVGCLDTPTSGKVFLDGIDISSLDENGLAAIRNEKIGFVFQQFNLLARINILDNVATPLLYSGMSAAQRREKAAFVLERVGLADRMKHLPRELSGGQKQRAAIARALVNDPSLLLADEPTGALDQETGRRILELFTELHEAGNTLVIVTHDPDIGAFAPRCIHILDGLIADDGMGGAAPAGLAGGSAGDGDRPAAREPAAVATAAAATQAAGQDAAGAAVIVQEAGSAAPMAQDAAEPRTEETAEAAGGHLK